MALHESFLTHRSSVWLKFAFFLCALCIGFYLWHDPIDGPNGGTWLGYTLGTIGALLIVWLAFLGVRKRSYRSNMGTVKGWTSAHVWLGISLIVVATLHSGFQFGWNIHTLAWSLMMLVIASGIWGVVAYIRYPDKITAAQGSVLAEDMVSEIAELDQQMLKLATELGRETHERTLRSIQRTRIGGGFWQQVRGIRDTSGMLDTLVGRLREEVESASTKAAPSMKKAQTGDSAMNKNETFMFMASDFVSAEQNEQERDKRRKLLDVLSRKKALVMELNNDITRRARMSVWLYFHVPLTIALIASLIVHVLSVFLYW